MYSIKPGRGPSMAGGFGGIIGAIFGVFWTISASSMGAPGMFTAFGVLFIFAALGSAVYNFYNATSKKRFSNLDITRPGEEPDPLAPERFSSPQFTKSTKKPSFCPYCGTGLKQDFEFCPQCGKDI